MYSYHFSRIPATIPGTVSALVAAMNLTIVQSINSENESSMVTHMKDLALDNANPNEQRSPFLFLDEFNSGSEQDISDLNRFMRRCQNLGFYLVIVTSEREIADRIMGTNAWGEMRPLKYIHNGLNSNIPGSSDYQENKTANWKKINWTVDQLKKVVISKVGEFDNYSFITPYSTPTDALLRAREKKGERDQESCSSSLCAEEQASRSMCAASYDAKVRRVFQYSCDGFRIPTES